MSVKSIINGFLNEQRTFGSRDDVLRIWNYLLIAKQKEKVMKKPIAKKVLKVKRNS